MLRKLLIMYCCLSAVSNSLAQGSSLNDLAHKMFFNILLHKPDSAVYDFVKAHFPVLTQPVVKGDWTIYPPGHDSIPVPNETMYSLNFKTHPLFKAPFKEGRLDILANETKGYEPGFRDFQLWFMFDTKADAEKGFSILSGLFNAVSKSKTFRIVGDRKIAAYSDKKVFDPFNAVEFILTKDELYDKKYKLFFRISAITYFQ
jgi:hypothetical protein